MWVSRVWAGCCKNIMCLWVWGCARVAIGGDDGVGHGAPGDGAHELGGHDLVLLEDAVVVGVL